MVDIQDAIPVFSTKPAKGQTMIDPKDAPDGFIAIRDEPNTNGAKCRKCAFATEPCPGGPSGDLRCMPGARADRESVYFVKTPDVLPATKAESDPTGRAPGEPGAKLDAGKAPILRGLLFYFPRACTAVADVSKYGANKYAWNGWETVPDGIDRYGDAMARHLAAEAIEPYDRESARLHAAHAAWNALARLELILRDNEKKA